jgi:myo-inositol 2-dehydrogenase / D-chiro-inositol 1-dehydrogenase
MQPGAARSRALCVRSRTAGRAIYGYDQRIEVLGSNGALRAENVVESTVSFAGADGIISDTPLPFFLERYAEAYRCELDHCISAIASGRPPLVSGSDGVRALALADAALESLRTGRAVRIQ